MFIAIILIVGLLANREVAGDEERARERRREYARFRSVFGEEDLSCHEGGAPEGKKAPDQGKQTKDETEKSKTPVN